MDCPNCGQPMQWLREYEMVHHGEDNPAHVAATDGSAKPACCADDEGQLRLHDEFTCSACQVGRHPLKAARH